MTERTSMLPFILILTCLLSSFPTNPVYSQKTIPEALETGTIREQFEYIEERTRIYNDFRAIREDIFQKLKSGTIDSIKAEKNSMVQLEGQLKENNNLIESLQEDLKDTRLELDRAVKNRNSFSLLGISVHKALYNMILWIVIAILGFLTGSFFLLNKKILTSAKQTRNELEETREEYEEYRKKMLRKHEQMVVKHHKELQKLKGN